MILPAPLFHGKLLKRYKRFLADIELDSGEIITAHCPNTGSMKQCAIEGYEVYVSKSSNPKRKLGYTWELVKINSFWNVINTILPNKIMKEAVSENMIHELAGYDSVRSEVKYGENSRIDLLLEKDDEKCYVEIKNVTLAYNNRAVFPDSVTTRGHKHINELIREVHEGNRAVMLFAVQRFETVEFGIADDIDPEYLRLLKIAVKEGVEVLAYKIKTDVNESVVYEKIPVVLS